jgi:hypothetical protein
VDRDDLLQPTLAGHERRVPGPKPWRLGSQVYVAFFGGPLAVGAIAAYNSVTLGMPRSARLTIAGIALAAEAAFAAAILLTETDSTRLFGIVAGLAAFGGVYLLQRSPDRVYHYHADDEEPYDSLFGAGLFAVIVARIAEAIVYAGVLGE